MSLQQEAHGLPQGACGLKEPGVSGLWRQRGEAWCASGAARRAATQGTRSISELISPPPLSKGVLVALPSMRVVVCVAELLQHCTRS